jgi:hypothetical protein
MTPAVEKQTRSPGPIATCRDRDAQATASGQVSQAEPIRDCQAVASPHAPPRTEGAM